MKKFLLVLGIVMVLVIGGLMYLRMETKSKSPADVSSFSRGDLEISITYNRPFKKGRVIFGELVPYRKVWRTGANEATIFKTNKDLTFGDKVLKAGSYSMFTIPEEQNWTLIFNSETGQWGITFNGDANRNPDKDVLSVQALSVQQEKEFEQFTISVENWEEEMQLIFMWDKTLVSVPFTVK
ncbi:MAG: DUF2911 domain-containing protein [Bacteroidetes bacterium CHB5]|nr:DUF2911 domain-containing protein [Bacteroidetes bacterium CHB5]